MAGKSVPIKVINPVVNYGYTIGCLSLLHFHGTNWFTCHSDALFFIEYWISFLFHNNVALMNYYLGTSTFSMRRVAALRGVMPSISASAVRMSRWCRMLGATWRTSSGVMKSRPCNRA